MPVAVAVIAVAAVLTVVAMVLLWPSGSGGESQPSGDSGTRLAGTVEQILIVPCEPATTPEGGAPGQPSGQTRCGTVRVRLTTGPDEGKRVSTPIPDGPGAPTLGPGDAVTILHLTDTPSGIEYQIIDHERGLQLWMLAAMFVVVVVAFGRLRGMAALVGLVVTFAILLLFVVPAIIDGRSPLLVAIVGASAVMLSVLYLTHGFTAATTMAVLGTLASLALTGLLAAVSTAALHLTGMGTEEATYVTFLLKDVNTEGLLLAGIVIGSLGVLDDVAVTQAFTVTELAIANPGYSPRQLYRAASRVGRAHITSVINTIILAYAGASLPLLILITAGNQPVGQLLTNQMMAQEIVRGIVGTLGLIAAVPITTGLASLVLRPRQVGGSKAPAPKRAKARPAPVDAGWMDDDDAETPGRYRG